MTGYKYYRPRPADGDTEWMNQAACRDADTNLFFPSRGEDIRPAKRICHGDPETGTKPCPVRQQCLDYALDNNERFGIFGGMSERERRRTKRNKKNAA